MSEFNITENVKILDALAYGNHHLYHVAYSTWGMTVKFQTGPIKEVGVNGVQDIDLAYILRDRLTRFNDAYPGEYNAQALEGIKQVISAMEARTRDRELRDVEGTSQA